MNNFRNLFFLFVVILSFSLVVSLACGDDDDDDSGGGDDDDDGPSDWVPGSGSISAYVRDFGTKAEVQLATVELVDNETGQPLGSAWKAESASGGDSGYVEFNNVPDELDQVGVRVTKDGNHDTYQYYFDVGSVDEEFLLVSRDLSSLVAILLDLDLDPAAGFAAGAVYWGDPTDENPVGCGVVQTVPEPVDGIFYFNLSDLPTTDRSLTPNEPESAENGKGINPANGYWIGMNIAAGTAVDVTATSGDKVETVQIPMSFADSVTIANVYYSKTDYPNDPTEPWCTE